MHIEEDYHKSYRSSFDDLSSIIQKQRIKLEKNE